MSSQIICEKTKVIYRMLILHWHCCIEFEEPDDTTHSSQAFSTAFTTISTTSVGLTTTETETTVDQLAIDCAPLVEPVQGYLLWKDGLDCFY